jgi:UDP-N-acetylglucosamine 3-dehydrogenase
VTAEAGPLRIGILGAGAMGTVHAAAWSDIAGARVVGVFSRDPTRASAAAAICNAQPVSDAQALIASADVDAIDVCLPSAVHRSVVVTALQAGKHVFCETPLALTLDDAEAMRDAARKAGRLLQVGLLMRSLPQYRHIKALVSSGEHGRLLSVATWRLGSYLRAGASDRKAHYSDPSTELMTFDFDFIQWAMGGPDRLSATATRTLQGAPGEISALIGFDDGRHATVLASGLMPSGFPFTVGFRALFEWACFELHTVFEDGPPKSTFTMFRDEAPGEIITLPGGDPYQAELRHFVDCMNGRADAGLLDVDRAIEALLLSLATQRALNAASVQLLP